MNSKLIKIKEFIGKYFWQLIVLSFLIFVLFMPKGCEKNNNDEEPKVITVIDTIWKKADTVYIKKMVPYTVIKTVPTKEYIPSDDCDSLKQQYLSIRDSYINKVVYKDSTKVTGFAKGNIVITDTLQFNKISNRKWEFNLEIPEVTKTVTIIEKEPKKRELYYGGNLFSTTEVLRSFTPGMIYKTKKDQIYQLNAGIEFTGNFIFGVGAYYKF
jgi:hypothetical protein